MSVIEVEKARLERGLPCGACGTALAPTRAYRATCPACKQLHVVAR